MLGPIPQANTAAKQMADEIDYQALLEASKARERKLELELANTILETPTAPEVEHKAKRVTSGQDLTASRFADRLSRSPIEPRINKTDREILDSEAGKKVAQFNTEPYKEVLTKCRYCGTETNSPSGFCNLIHQTNYYAKSNPDNITRAGKTSRMDQGEPNLPSFDEVRWGKKPLAAWERREARVKAEAKRAVLGV